MRNKLACGLLLVFTLTGCMSSMIASQMRKTGEVLHEYKEGGQRYMVIRNGDIVQKWRQDGTGAAAPIYEVDAALQVCKSSNQVVDCARMKNEKDLGQYVTWL